MPGLYLFACDRKETIQERVQLIELLQADHHFRPHVVPIMSPSTKTPSKPGTSVRVKVEALPHTYRSGHVIALITHNALMDADLSCFSGWELVVDETPSVFETKPMSNALTWTILRDHFEIIPGDAFNAIISKDTDRATTASFARDTMAQSVASLHRRVVGEQYHVLTDLHRWADLADEPAWQWSSIWSPAQLRCFDSVTVLANAFDRSLTYHLFQALHPESRWRRSERPNTRLFKRRKMTITYFARGHDASRGWFNRDQAKKHLGRIASFIRNEVGSAGHIWTSNDTEATSLSHMPGQRLAPRQAGSNKYAHIDHVSMIYCAKPNPAEVGVLKALGIDPAAATETRERETIYQFTGRCSVRDPTSERPIWMWVYSEAQAQYLEEMYAATDYIDVELRPFDLGYLDHRHDSKTGRKVLELSDEEIVAQAQRKRDRARERKRESRLRAKENAALRAT